MNPDRSFAAFSARKTREAGAARINPLRTLIDRSAAFPLEAIGNDWSIRMYGGPFVTARGSIDVNRSLIFNVPDVPVFVIGSSVACAALASDFRHRPWVRLVPLEPSGLRGALSTLRIDHGLRRISAIGGRTTATALVDEGLVQDLHLTTGVTGAGEPHTP